MVIAVVGFWFAWFVFLFVSVPSFQSVADLGGQAGSDPDYRLVEW